MRVVAKQLMAPGKGILATDARSETMDKRMKAVGIEPTEETRRKFREILITTPGIGEFLSGVILNEEVLRLAPLAQDKSIIVGIKVDLGVVDFGQAEKVTEGLEGLEGRLGEYKQMGAMFTKWRVVVNVGEGIPTAECLRENAWGMAKYASLSQQQGLVPIVEPEVLMEGGHKIEECERATEQTLRAIFRELHDKDVGLEEMLLKTNMVLPGSESGQEVDDEEMARRTMVVLKRVVPVGLAGVVFLSGGQEAKLATKRLNAICKQQLPWRVSFSFERALEGPAMEVWGGKEENVEKAQEIFLHRAKMNSLASQGRYTLEMENEI